MKKIYFLKLIILSFMGCYPTLQYTRQSLSSRPDCDLTPLRLHGSVRLHRTKKHTFFVSSELIGIARHANQLLSDFFGTTLFEIKHLEDKGDGSEVYISDDKTHFEHMKKRYEQGKDNDYLAYCSWQNYNQITGEIYESDIVFNPILYDQPRESLTSRKKSFEKTKRSVDSKIDRAKKECKKYIDVKYIYDDCLKAYDDLKKTTSKMARSIKNNHRTEKEDIYTQTLKTMIHEMGHALGLAHTPHDKENVMHPIIGGSILTGKQIDAVLCRFKKN